MVQCHIYNGSPITPSLSQINPALILTSVSLRFIEILPSATCIGVLQISFREIYLLKFWNALLPSSILAINPGHLNLPAIHADHIAKQNKL